MKGAEVGATVAVIGAGGIGFDLCEKLVHSGPSTSLDVPAFMAEWGVDMTLAARGGVEDVVPRVEPSPRTVFLLQRKTTKVGAGLGKTTGWIHRMDLAKKGVHMIGGCDYRRIDDQGLHLVVEGEPRILGVDTVVICAGQMSNRALADEISGLPVHIVGGADVASELDAKRAIDQATRLAAII
jgi:2,4-dienoyl-CoA reductase (NADPH2)